MSLRYAAVRGPDIADADLHAVARLRIDVFREWPYLYDGDAAYESDYLATYTRSPHALFVLAREGERIVGASTAVPLRDEDAALHAPFKARGIDVDSVLYCGESVLLREFRSQGAGHRFFDAREAHARALGLRMCAFAAVDRDLRDPRRPSQARTLDGFWHARGYTRQPDMTFPLAWREVGQAHETEHSLTVWTRTLA